jgi:hypothetical protein
MGRKKKVVVEPSEAASEPKLVEKKAERMDKKVKLSENELSNHPKFAKFKNQERV